MPLTSLLDEWDAVSSMFVPYPNEWRSPFASDEYICFSVYGDACLGEDGDGAVVRSFPALISDVEKLVNVSAFVARFDNCEKGSRVTFFAMHVSPFAV